MTTLIYGAKAATRLTQTSIHLMDKHVYMNSGTRDDPENGQMVARLRDRNWRLADGVPGGVKTTEQLVIAQSSDGELEPLEAWSDSRALGFAPVFVLDVHDGLVHLKGAEGLGGSGKPWGVSDTVAWLDRSGYWHNHAGPLPGGVEIAPGAFFGSLPPLPKVVPLGFSLRPSALAERLAV